MEVSVPKPQGLTSLEADNLFQQYGPNSLVRKKEHSVFIEFLLKFKNPLIFVLLFASVVSFFLGQWVSSLIIVFMIFLSTVLDFTNTYKSQKAVEALINKVRITASVFRDGKLQEMPVTHIVVRDLISLLPGDIVPADGQIVSSKDLFIDESSLTGESYPVSKNLSADVFMGSNVVAGEALVEIRATGKDTKFSKIAEALVKKDTGTDFDKGISDFSYLIVRLISVLVVVVFFVNAFFRHSLFDSFLFAVALAVGLTPELLPMVITINLARGSIGMSKKGVIVKKLSAIQNFGSMDILCSDKTGTLTEDKITLVKYVDSDGRESEQVLFYSYLDSFFQSGLKSPLDKALRDFKKIDVTDYKKIDEIPFDSIRRRDSTVVENKEGARCLISKGAPEEIFKLSSHYGSDARKEFDEDEKNKAHTLYDSLSRDGFRVLGVAIKKVSSKNFYGKEDEKNLAFLGFVAFLDPPKSTVTKTLKTMRDYGIETKIITGDNDLVTLKVASLIGLSVRGVLLGSAIEEMDDPTLAAAAEKTTIFARVSPEQKVRIIRALRSNGHVVGYLGDGINDAPSLKAADVSISVDNAVDVAKESADLILLKKSLRDLIEGVVEGRKTFANTMKYLMMALSSNFGNMLSMAGASLFLPFLPMLPQQILLNNLLYDSSQFTISVDSVDVEDTKKPRRWGIQFIKKYMIIFGILSSSFDILTFIVLIFIFHLAGAPFQTGWFLASFASQALVVHVLRTRKIPFFESRPTKALLASTFGAVILSWIIVFSRAGQLFQFTHLTAVEILAMAAIVVVYLLTMELTKRWFYRKISA